MRILSIVSTFSSNRNNIDSPILPPIPSTPVIPVLQIGQKMEDPLPVISPKIDAAPKEAPSEEIPSTDKQNLPGATEHPILRLDDETLKATSIDVLMADYGESDGGGSCFQDFGNNLITRWRDTKRDYCPRKAESGNQNKLNSHIDCYLVHQTRHHGNGDNLCLMENVALDLSKFDDTDFTTPVMRNYVNTKHMKQPYPPFPKGFLVGDCEPDRNLWKESYFPGWNTQLVHQPYQQLQNIPQDFCKEWIDHTVVLTERDTFANFFHDSEDFVNIFITLAVLQLKPKDIQIFLMDLYPQGPFWNIWSEVYSHQYPALTAFDLKKKYKRNNDGSPHYVCFKSLAMSIYGPAAPTTIASWDTPCKKTALVRSYSDFVIRSLNLQQFTHYAQPTPSKTITITYMARKPTKEWPEKKYCDDINSFFLCDYWRHFGSRQLGRMVANDNEVLQTLKRLEAHEYDFLQSLPSGIKIRVQAVDFNVLTFKEQIKVDLETDIMIGPHGAGLMHNIFMRDRAILIELFVDGSSANRHFHNLASWYGRQYEGIPMGNPVNPQELLDIVKRNIKKLKFNSY